MIYVIAVILFAFLAYRKNALSGSGAIAAIAAGLFVLFGLSLFGLAVLAVFFVSSTLLGRVLKSSDDSMMEEKGGRRDAGQVGANGGVAAACAVLYGYTGHILWAVSFVAALAAAASDTWATEAGKKSKKQPVQIFTLRPVPAGQSGGITALGTGAAFFGSVFVTGAACLLLAAGAGPDELSVPPALFVLAALAGFAGQWADSIAGALYQGLYKCRECSEITERRKHCGKDTRLIKGSRNITNDAVNYICTASAVVFVWLAGLAIFT
ncbi:DUF92 domain-containing protein [Evansella sp. LMS18]|jgi:uncharacterized protein (TIGR00297 family)|uniref:DUF92 domain-containing protein n=1 Tax=Evansella sp. LMS18 TaxID=2924033 RepID=UPI0020D1E41D|nr:DUF92 domain-containing protein [Evansella sp. LMS18]UTR09408.1 DUF92 domain-containing protein [Evansella sp. LMS18]